MNCPTGTTSSSRSCGISAADWKSARVSPGRGAARLDAHGVDFRHIPAGIRLRQLPMTSPKIRTGTPRACRCEAIERPQGPAPTMTVGPAAGLTLTVMMLLPFGAGQSRLDDRDDHRQAAPPPGGPTR